MTKRRVGVNVLDIVGARPNALQVGDRISFADNPGVVAAVVTSRTGRRTPFKRPKSRRRIARIVRRFWQRWDRNQEARDAETEAEEW